MDRSWRPAASGPGADAAAAAVVHAPAPGHDAALRRPQGGGVSGASGLYVQRAPERPGLQATGERAGSAAAGGRPGEHSCMGTWEKQPYL